MGQVAGGASDVEPEAALASLLLQMANSTTDAFVCADAAGLVIYANPAVANLLGYAPSELLGAPLSRLVPPQFREAHERGFDRLVKGGASHLPPSVEVPALRRDGGEVAVELTLCHFRQGGSVLVGAILRDVSERKARERALSEARRLLDAVFDHVPSAISVKTASDGRIVMINRAAEILSGQSREDILGRTVVDVIGDATGLQLSDHDQAVVATGRAQILEEATVRTADGEPRLTRSVKVPMRDDGGQITHVLTVMDDVSDAVAASDARRRAEIAERERSAAEEVMALFVRNAPVPLVMTDRELSILDVSGTWETLYGETAAAVRGRRMLDRAGSGEQAGFWRNVYARALEGESLTGEEPVASSLGAGWFEWVVTPWRDATGEVAGLLLMSIEVTRLIAARDAASAADRAKSQFLAAMSHELRTPLNGILGLVGAISSRNVDPEQAEMLGRVSAAGDRLSDMLGAILDFVDLETGDVSAQEEDCDVEAICRAALAAALARAPAATLRFDAAERLPRTLVTDRRAVELVLRHLVDNAVKFTPAGGEITVGARYEGDRIRLYVADTGRGFDGEDFDRLRRPFVQGDGTATRDHDGAGLGLAIVDGLVSRLGGSLQAQSAPGAGAMLTVLLPARDGDMTADESAEVSESADGRLRVLAVDDNATNLAVLRAILNAVGAEVTSATDGMQAVTAHAETDFDLILMDVQMPVMDGLTATRAIRMAEVAEGRARTPILVVSANTLRSDVAAALTAGADDFLPKPVDTASLFLAISKCRPALAA